MTADEAPPPPVSTRSRDGAPHADVERRQLTAMFRDLVGSTAPSLAPVYGRFTKASTHPT
jgi:hypothetical protein